MLDSRMVSDIWVAEQIKIQVNPALKKGQPSSNNNSQQRPRRRRRKSTKPASAANKQKPPLSNSSNSFLAKDRAFVKRLEAASDFREQIAADYVKHIIDPEHTTPVGVPDIAIGVNDTALIQSVISVDIPVNFDGTQDSGRFGIVINPTMGDSSDPTTYKVAVVDSSTSWPTDFSVGSSFLTNIGQTDLTVDPNTRMLLNPPTTYASLNTNVAAINQPTDPLAITAGFMTYDPVTDNFMNPNVGAAPYVAPGTVTTPIAAYAATLGRAAAVFTLPPGQYLFSWDGEFGAGAGDATAQSVAIVQGSQNVAWTIIETTGDLVSPNYSAIVSVFQNAGQFWFAFTSGVLPVSALVATTSLNTSWARPDQLATRSLAGGIPPGWLSNNTTLSPSYPIDGGVIREYLPVSMTALFTCNAPELTIAGDVACAWLPPNTCANDVFTPAARAQVGNLFNVANTRKLPMYYDGKFRDGCYQIWRPSGTDDTHLYSPSNCRDRDWPCLIISGKVTGGAAGVAPVAKLRVVTTYQFSTDFKGFDLKKRPGSREAMDEAFQVISSYPLASANGVHLDNARKFLRNMVAKAGRFWEDNASWLKPAATALLSAI